MDADDDIDNNEGEDFDWMSEGTYCSTNVTPRPAPNNDCVSQRIVSSQTKFDDVVSEKQKIELSGSQNNIVSSAPLTLPSKELSKDRLEKDCAPSQTEKQSTYIIGPTDESSEDEIAADCNANNGNTSNKYLTIPQRVLRTLSSGVQHAIRILVPHDFLKKHKEPCAMFTCPLCSTLTTDLQSLDDHMISLHDIGSNTVAAENNSVGDATLTVLEEDSSKQLSTFSCSLCSLSLVSTQEWQLHFYLHLTNRIKRGENSKPVTFAENDSSNENDVSIVNSSDKANGSVDLLQSDRFLTDNASDSNINDDSRNETEEPVKRKRGRKRKSDVGVSEDSYEGKAKVMTCKVCSRFRYTKVGEIKRHMLNEHGDQLHKCTYCEMAFPLGYEVLRHIRLYHSKFPSKQNTSSYNKPVRALGKRGRGRPRLIAARSDSDQDDDSKPVSSVIYESRKRLFNIRDKRKATPKKRRIVSDSEDDTEKNIEANEVMPPGETSEATEASTSQQKAKLPVGKPRGGKNGIGANRRKGTAMKLQRTASDDEESSLASEDGNDDPDWKDLKVRTMNSSQRTRMQPVRMSAEEVKRVTGGANRGRGRPRKGMKEIGERKSGQLIVCDHCGCCYEKRKELVEHITTEHSDKMLKCTKCTKSFALPKTLKVHLMICHAEETFNCSRCDMKFVTLNRLRLHVRIDHLGRPMAVVKKKLYGCSYCSRMFQTKQTLDGHTNQHHLNVRPYKCSKCSIDFAYINNFKIHERICLRSAMCELCGENFPNKGKLAEHQKSVHNTVLEVVTDENKPEFFCDHCNKEFLDETSLKAHLTRVRSAAQRSSVLCDICGKECKKAAGLTMHKAHCHPNEAKSNTSLPTSNAPDAAAEARAPQSNGDALATSPAVVKTPVQCSDCNKMCRTPAALRIHRTRMHSNSISCRSSGGVSNAESLCCPTCGQVCKGKVGLNSHLRSHGSAEPNDFKCDKCDRAFDNKFGLDMHRRHAHTDTRKYRQVAPCTCPICSKEFPREGPMKSHMTIVHGLAPATKKKPVQPAADKVFDCPICSHQFKMKAYLQRHLRVHAGTKPYICTLCAKCFTSSTNLAGHMAALHKEVDYTYNPLVNMVCNVAANGGIPQPSIVVSRSTPSAPRKSGGSSRKNSSSRKNTQPAASTGVGDNFSTGTEAAPAAPSRNESVVGYTDDVLNMSREMQLMPRNMSSMLPVLSRDISNMMPPVIARDMSNMPRDIQGLMVPREMANMPRDMSTIPRENPSIPQYAIGTMPTNWNYAYMGEFYRL